jgi:predicted membrane protein
MTHKRHALVASAFVYGLLSSIIELLLLAALAVHARRNQASRK